MSRRRKCAIPLCHTHTLDPADIKYHIIPKQPSKLRHDWLKACQLPPTDKRKDLRICKSHFCESDYKPPRGNVRKRFLKSYVVPHLNIPRELTRFLPPDLVLPESVPFSDILPVKPVPLEDSPAIFLKSEDSPDKPAKKKKSSSKPSEDLPKKNDQSEDLPLKTDQSEDSTHEDLPLKVEIHEDSKSENSPSKDLPPKAVPLEFLTSDIFSLPLEPVPPERLPYKLLPSELVPIRLPSELVPPRQPSPVNLSDEDLDSELFTPDDLPTDNLCSDLLTRNSLPAEDSELLSDDNDTSTPHSSCIPFDDFHNYSVSKKGINPIKIPVSNENNVQTEKEKVSPSIRDKFMIEKLRAKLKTTMKALGREKSRNEILNTKLREETLKKKATQKSNLLLRNKVEKLQNADLDKTKLMAFLEERGFTSTEAKALIYKKNRIKYSETDILKGLDIRKNSTKLYDQLRKKDDSQQYHTPLPCKRTLRKWEVKLGLREPG